MCGKSNIKYYQKAICHQDLEMQLVYKQCRYYENPKNSSKVPAARKF